MKKLLLLSLVLGACEPEGKRESKDGYNIITIDSCEYIEVSFLTGANNGYYSLTHKGNCKFCRSRN